MATSDARLLAPDAFILIAEETSLIISLGRWVMLAACRQLRKWQVQFPSQRPLTIAVNVSNKQFAMPTFADEIAGILSPTGLDPRCLRLEITETAAMEDADLTLQTLLRLNSMGVLIDLDDFGTGYSSLSYLHRMPIHALKIDRGFIGPMKTDTMSRSIAQAITTLAHSLNLHVIAEGVETEAHVEAVRQIGCDFMQGYHFSAPMPVEEATKFIAASCSRALAASA